MPLRPDIKEKGKEDKDKTLDEQNDYRDYLRKVGALRAEISTLEKEKTAYVNFQSALATLSGNLGDLGRNLGYASEYLAEGYVSDSVTSIVGNIKDTSVMAGDFATRLSSNNKLIEDKIRIIDSQLRAKRSKLSSLSQLSE